MRSPASLYLISIITFRSGLASTAKLFYINFSIQSLETFNSKYHVLSSELKKCGGLPRSSLIWSRENSSTWWEDRIIMKLATATAALWMIMKSSRTVLSTGNWSLINSLAVAPLLMITRDLCCSVRNSRKFPGKSFIIKIARKWPSWCQWKLWMVQMLENILRQMLSCSLVGCRAEEMTIIVSGQWRDLTARILLVISWLSFSPGGVQSGPTTMEF